MEKQELLQMVLKKRSGVIDIPPSFNFVKAEIGAGGGSGANPGIKMRGGDGKIGGFCVFYIAINDDNKIEYVLGEGALPRPVDPADINNGVDGKDGGNSYVIFDPSRRKYVSHGGPGGRRLPRPRSVDLEGSSLHIEPGASGGDGNITLTFSKM